MECEGLCDCGYHCARLEGPFCPRCTSEMYIRHPAAEPASDCEGLCLCDYKSAQPQGPFCPRCSLRLFLRHTLPRPRPNSTLEGGLAVHTQHKRHRRDSDNLSNRPALGAVNESRPADSLGEPTVGELHDNGDLIVRIDGRLIRYTRGVTPSGMTPRDSARADQASQNFPTSRPHEPSNELPNDSEATPCDGSNNRTEKEDSAPPSRRLHPLGQVSQGQRSRSPRRREFDSEADNFRHRSRSHRRTDTGQHASRAPLQELRGGDRRQRRPRRHNRGNKTTLPASADENSEEATTSDALLPPSPPKAPTHEQTQTPGPKPSQQERLVTATQEKPKAVADGHQSQPTSTPVQNNDKLPPPVDLLRLDADIQQLIDEERAIAEKKLSGRTDGGQADEHHELPTVDDGVPKGHEISRKVGDVEIVSSHNSLLRRNGVQQPRTSNEAPDNGLPAQIQLDWCLRCHRTGHRVTTPCPNLMVERAVPNVRRNWSAYYRRNIAAPPSGPVTVIHVINISHRLSLQFNQFDVYVTDRDGFLQEVDRYLKSCLSIPCYVAWLACLSFCNATVETYLDGLVRTVNNLQYDTVLRALFQAITNKNRRPDYFQGRRLSDLPESECIRLMDGTRALHAIVRIDQLKYSMALDSLNSERTAYKAKHREALRRVEELVYRNRDALRSKKIRVALRSLSSVMLDPGRDEKLNRISPNDIPLPRILRLREDWSVIRDDEM